MLGAVDFGHKEMKVVINAIIELAEVAAKEPIDLLKIIFQKKKRYNKIVKKLSGEFEKAYKIQQKSDKS